MLPSHSTWQHDGWAAGRVRIRRRFTAQLQHHMNAKQVSCCAAKAWSQPYLLQLVGGHRCMHSQVRLLGCYCRWVGPTGARRSLLPSELLHQHRL